MATKTDAAPTYIGHDENTAPKNVGGVEFISPATFVPLSQNPISVNTKAEKGAVKGE